MAFRPPMGLDALCVHGRRRVAGDSWYARCSCSWPRRWQREPICVEGVSESVPPAGCNASGGRLLDLPGAGVAVRVESDLEGLPRRPIRSTQGSRGRGCRRRSTLHACIRSDRMRGLRRPRPRPGRLHRRARGWWWWRGWWRGRWWWWRGLWGLRGLACRRGLHSCHYCRGRRRVAALLLPPWSFRWLCVAGRSSAACARPHVRRHRARDDAVDVLAQEVDGGGGVPLEVHHLVLQHWAVGRDERQNVAATDLHCSVPVALRQCPVDHEARGRHSVPTRLARDSVRRAAAPRALHREPLRVDLTRTKPFVLPLVRCRRGLAGVRFFHEPHARVRKRGQVPRQGHRRH